MNKLNFSNSIYKCKALNLQTTFNNVHLPSDAFLLLINGIESESLSNLCNLMYKNKDLFCTPNISITSVSDCYNITQNVELCKEDKELILSFAIECLNNGLYLGEKTINYGKNTSSWIGHSVYVGEVCANLAKILGLDDNIARTLGLLHDYGRKFSHGFNHVIKGYEALIELGWYDESFACLTHSFVKGGRCSNNERAIEGFYVDEEGNPRWKEGTKQDDVTLFLQSYKYTDYDIILNIADLMATSYGIVSPYDRIKDIATRREVDITNRGYFLADITNVYIDFLKKINYIDENTKYIKATKDVTLEEIEDRFKEVSEYFFEMYMKLSNEKDKSI